MTGEVFLNRSGPSFLLARLIEDGIVKRHLDETFPGSGYRMCVVKDQLPSSARAWLWAKQTPFNYFGKFTGMHEEASRIITDSLRRYPWLHLETAARAGVRQFFTFETGTDVIVQEKGIATQIEELEPTVRELLPRERPAYLAARQQRNALICGAVSFPADRYQLRIAWVLLFWLMLWVAKRRRV